MSLPETVDLRQIAARLQDVPGFYDYRSSAPGGGAVEWHVNFADPNLFVAYGTALFAQDELQVAEHPVLGSLKETLLSEGLPTVTVEGSEPTPVLITDVERRCRVLTDPDPVSGRPRGLYGNEFRRADTAAVRSATEPIDPPTRTNLIAMAAPLPGHGTYARYEIEYSLVAAYTGYRAAVLESKRGDSTAETVVHTGFWGCGAFGGNRVLMVGLQAIAAECAGVDRIIVHTGAGGAGAIADARAMLEAVSGTAQARVTVRGLITRILEMGFEWGRSDGN